jgi:hypothetical protein
VLGILFGTEVGSIKQKVNQNAFEGLCTYLNESNFERIKIRIIKPEIIIK